MTSSLLVLSASDVDRITSTFSPKELMLLMSQAFLVALCSGAKDSPSAYTPHRTSIPIKNHAVLFMPARIVKSYHEVSDFFLPGTTIKVVSVPSSSGDLRGIPASTLVLDEETGGIKAIINARDLTALRTAAGSLCSTVLVGPRKPTSIVAFGTGKQIQAHLILHLTHFPSICSCTVIYRSNARTPQLRSSLEHRFPSVTFTYFPSQTTTLDDTTMHIKAALWEASIIVCATPSTKPLFPSHWVRAGTHVILVGSFRPEMKEVQKELIERAVPVRSDIRNVIRGVERDRPRRMLVVDSRLACKLEAGEIIDAGLSDEDVVEIGDLIEQISDFDSFLDSAIKREDAEEVNGAEDDSITLFKSVGLGVQDVAIACAVIRKAEEMGDIGTRVLEYDV
ncbi:hypothetical protein M378DRAFT_83327 [Amanita muscaria Koide BX008]|uniref:NAD(P)-binding protein n=1 Tax=Amanita muscaria (strain Koide BX008) TaxID=946122 RepID=A0A0C2WVD8_AMAMK|nr:hypothetical protein M378DRAFT_83327 [Amanita muscaria Koide BX008]